MKVALLAILFLELSGFGLAEDLGSTLDNDLKSVPRFLFFNTSAATNIARVLTVVLIGGLITIYCIYTYSILSEVNNQGLTRSGPAYR